MLIDIIIVCFYIFRILTLVQCDQLFSLTWFADSNLIVNQLNGAIPSTIGSLTNLQTLYVNAH